MNAASKHQQCDADDESRRKNKLLEEKAILLDDCHSNRIQPISSMMKR